MNELKIIITCEHGGNQVPAEYSEYFLDHKNILKTHRGWDIGSYEVAIMLSEKLKVPLFGNLTTRLLVDLNRSLYRHTLFSEITKPFDKKEKLKILNQYYYPYRNKVEKKIRMMINEGYFVLHISVHSFTPFLRKQIRKADIGILYNPERSNEKCFARVWKQAINEVNSDLRIRFNYPYLGKPDGFPAYFRKIYNDRQYSGFEFEINQKFFTNKHPELNLMKQAVIIGLMTSTEKFFGTSFG